MIGGVEFKSFSEMLQQFGIQHIYILACHHILKQNGLVERKHMHIVETGLALLAQASLPIHLWAHAFLSVVYVINKLSTLVLQGKSPHKMIHKVKPDYFHLRTFGCCCYLYLRPYNRYKLQFRTKAYIFLNHSPQHKGYKCFDESGGIFISRHVIFYEHCFPFASRQVLNFPISSRQ